MRPGFARPIASAGAALLFALASVSGTLAENAQSETSQSDAAPMIAASAADERLPQKNLNSVPLDGFGSDANIGSTPLVSQLTAARPNEDLVICVAGCFSGRDRVVFAKPIDRRTPTKIDAAAATGASDGTGGSIAQGLRGTQ